MCRSHSLPVLMLTLAALGMSACGSSSATSRSASVPEVDRPGRFLVRSSGAELEIVTSTRFADANPGEPWLLLPVSITGQRAAAVEIAREAIAVRTPDGRWIPLASQELINESYGELQSALRRADLGSEPLNLGRGGLQPCALDLQRLPGSGASRESVFVDQRKVCGGTLAFPVPGGVQPGPWKLRITLEEAEVELPFELGSAPR